MGALVPIAGGGVGASGPVPYLRVIPGGAAAGAAVAAAVAGTPATGGLVGAAGAVGSVVGPVAAVLGAFALGFEAGKLLLAAWELLNRTGGDRPLALDNDDVDTWPLPDPATGLTISWVYRSEGYFDPVIRDRVYDTSTTGLPYVYDVIPNGYYAGLDSASLDRGNGMRGAGIAGGGSFRLLAINNPGGGPIPPRLAPGDPAPPRSGPLEQLQRAADSVGVPLPAPLAFVPPAQPVIPSAPSRAPVVVPAPVIAPAPAVRPSAPAGRPGPSTAPGTLPTLTPGPGQAPAQQPQPSTFPQVDPARPPVPIGPNGIPLAPAAPVVPVTPPDVVNYPGLTVGDPGARPRPDLDSIARELGRQEQKLAGLLSGLGYPEAFDRLIDLITSFNPGTTYLLHPPCGTDANGDPLPPVEVVVPASIGESAAILNRLDALAMLLDEHKTMRQPICKGKPTGEAVTVTFVEAE